MADHAAGGEGVGSGRLGAAALEADRARQRTGAVRPHLHHALPVDPRQRAAALPDRGHRHRGYIDREVADDFAVALRHLAVNDHRHVGAGAADIQAKDAVEAAGAGEIAGADYARGGAGEDHLHAFALRLLDAHHAAVGFSDARRCGYASGAQRALELLQIVDHHRLHVGVDGGGDSALVFTDNRPDVGGTGGQQVGRDLFDDRLYRRLVVSVAVAVQQRYHNALTARRARAVDGGQHALTVNGLQHLAVAVGALVDGEDAIAANQRRGPTGEEIVDMGNFQPRQLQHVAKAGGGEQRQPDAAPLDHRVNADRGAVGEVANLCGIEAVALGELRQSGENFAARRIGPRQHFKGMDLAGLPIQHGEIGKGSANVHANAVTHLYHSRVRREGTPSACAAPAPRASQAAGRADGHHLLKASSAAPWPVPDARARSLPASCPGHVHATLHR